MERGNGYPFVFFGASDIRIYAASAWKLWMHSMITPIYLFKAALLSCAVTLVASTTYSQTAPALHDPTTWGDIIPPSRAVIHQCGGLLRFRLDLSDDFARSGNHDLVEDIELVRTIYGYFQGQTQVMKMQAGLDSEAANYESGLTMFAYAQLYRTRLVEMMENGDDCSAFYQFIAADFEICEAVFRHYE